MVFNFDKLGMPLPSGPGSSIEEATRALWEKVETYDTQSQRTLRDVLGYFFLAAQGAERGSRGEMDEYLAAASLKADILIRGGLLQESDVATVDVSIRKLLKKDLRS